MALVSHRALAMALGTVVEMQPRSRRARMRRKNPTEVSPGRALPDPRLLPALKPSWSRRGPLRRKGKAELRKSSPTSPDIIEDIVKEFQEAAPGMARETVTEGSTLEIKRPHAAALWERGRGNAGHCHARRGWGEQCKHCRAPKFPKLVHRRGCGILGSPAACDSCLLRADPALEAEKSAPCRSPGSPELLEPVQEA